MKCGEWRKADRSISRLRRDLMGGGWSIFPWARADPTSEVRALEVHMDVCIAFLRRKMDMAERTIGAHFDHLRSEYEGASLLDAVTSFAWALSGDFKGPNMDYLDEMEKEARKVGDNLSMVAIMYARATATESSMDSIRQLLRKALSVCVREDLEDSRKKVVEYLSLRSGT